MKAVVYTAATGLSLEERTQPKLPPPRCVTLNVEYVGLSSTDYEIIKANQPPAKSPVILGHEISATVAEVGHEVHIDIGAPVVVNPYIPCGACRTCDNGRSNCCTSLKVIGLHIDGALREQIVVPATNVYLARDLDLHAAAMVQLLAIAVHAVRRAQISTTDDDALVIGCGPVGLSIAFFLRDDGHQVTLVDKSAERVRMAKDLFGFTSVLHADAAYAHTHTVAGNYPVIFDATGSALSVQNAFSSLLACGGTLVSVGITNETIQIDLSEAQTREKALIFARNSTPDDFIKALNFATSNNDMVASMVTKVTTLEDAPIDITKWATDKSGLLKGVVHI